MMKSLFNAAMLKEQLKRYWAIGALSFLAYFLVCLLPIWREGGTPYSVLLSLLDMKHPIMLIMNIMVPLSAVVAIFSYMYRQNSAGVIHSLPFTKTQLFATNFLAGYLLIAIPLLLFSLLLLVSPVKFTLTTLHGSYSYGSYNVNMNIFPNGLYVGDVINTFPVVCGFFARTLLSFTFYYALFVMAAMIVGNQIMYFLVSALLPFLAMGFYLLFGLVSMYYVFGFTFDLTPFEYIFVYTNPVAIYSLFTTVRIATELPATFSGEIASPVSYYAVYAAITVALIAGSACLYHKRKLERAGDTIVFTPVKNFFIFILSITGMLSLGLLLLFVFESVAFMYAGFAGGFVISFFIALMIVEKSFNVLNKYRLLLKHCCVIAGVFAVLIFVSKTDITGYERYVPDVSEIEGVYLSLPGIIQSHTDDDALMKKMFISDTQIIEEAVSAHKSIIDNKRVQRKVFNDVLATEYGTRKIMIENQSIVYRLKGGRTIAREYVLSKEFYESSGLSDLMLSEPVLVSDIYWANYPEELDNIAIQPLFTEYYHEMEGEDIVSTSYTNYKSIVIYDPNEMKSLTEAIKQDYIYSKIMMKDYDFTKAEGLPIGSGMRVEVRALTKPGTKFKGGNGYIYNPDNELSVQFYINPEYCENTLEWLRSNGYGLTEISSYTGQ